MFFKIQKQRKYQLLFNFYDNDLINFGYKYLGLGLSNLIILDKLNLNFNIT